MQLTKPSNLRKESVIFRKPKTDKHGNEIIKIQTKYDESKTGALDTQCASNQLVL